MPVSGVTVAHYARVFLSRAHRRPAFPAPSDYSGRKFWSKASSAWRCEVEVVLESCCCLKIDLPSSLRTQGPITPGGYCDDTLVQQVLWHHPQSQGHGVWVPAFAGTTLRVIRVTMLIDWK